MSSSKTQRLRRHRQSVRKADVGIEGGRIEAIGRLERQSATTVIDASELAVAPGFINMLSWSVVSLIVDGRSQSEIRQGLTTEVFGRLAPR